MLLYPRLLDKSKGRNNHFCSFSLNELLFGLQQPEESEEQVSSSTTRMKTTCSLLSPRFNNGPDPLHRHRGGDFTPGAEEWPHLSWTSRLDQQQRQIFSGPTPKAHVMLHKRLHWDRRATSPAHSLKVPTDIWKLLPSLIPGYTKYHLVFLSTSTWRQESLTVPFPTNCLQD